MDFLEINASAEPGMVFIALVAFGAGLIRGFTGFGGPAFMLAILTLFFTPYSIVSKILVVDFIASVYLFKVVYRQIDWRATACMVAPTLVFMPLGHWLLIELDPVWMKRAMALIIATACVMMLVGFRYKHPMTTSWLIFVGICAGIVFGGSYIALVAVVFILLGPYDKHQGRTLIISWSFFTVLGFALISALSGTTGIDDVIAAAPGAATYLLGTWVGSHGFRKSSEKLFRRAAIATLLALSLVNMVS
ncbi:MAG: sulfite exporter TauE/SafE family protein [Gammaproteobacteria bacterium]|nr:sulfite exporter TauE/SafE family protein [Gammaproteobacteria bacterium]MDH3857161.1 sulfite exporter TauE/SafE family protein [Gammaproteobacteria bacterium]